MIFVSIIANSFHNSFYDFPYRSYVIRSGTREVHNKLEKNRRAHLKECFELLKRQLPSQDEKKSSNLSILHAANKYIQVHTYSNIILL